MHVKTYFDATLKDLKSYNYQYENDFEESIRNEKLGILHENKTLQHLLFDYDGSKYKHENLKNILDIIENEVNFIDYLYQISASLR